MDCQPSCAIDSRAAEFAGALELLDHDIRQEQIELPDLPRQVVWEEIWKWLELRRTRFDRWMHGAYRRSAILSRARGEKIPPSASTPSAAPNTTASKGPWPRSSISLSVSAAAATQS